MDLERRAGQTMDSPLRLAAIPPYLGVEVSAGEHAEAEDLLSFGTYCLVKFDVMGSFSLRWLPKPLPNQRQHHVEGLAQRHLCDQRCGLHPGEMLHALQQRLV